VSDSPDPVAAGRVVTYRVLLRNAGPSDASQPRLTMPLPTRTTLVGATQAGGSAFHCTSDGHAVTCAADSLAAGGSAAIDVAVRTGPNQHGTITASPTVSAATTDPDTANNASSETTEVTPPPPNLTIGRTVGKRRSGVIVVALGCRSVVNAPCTTTLTVTFKRPHQDLPPITRRASVRSGRRTIVYLIGPQSERRMIKQFRLLPVRVTATNPPGPDVVRDAVIVGTLR
jgi:uncharacterized repeat protein (TIGR01451 family)